MSGPPPAQQQQQRSNQRRRSRRGPPRTPSVPVAFVQPAVAQQPRTNQNPPRSRRQKKRYNRRTFNSATGAYNSGNPEAMVNALKQFASSGINEQDFTLGVDFRNLPKHVQYAFCLLYPKQFQCRIPDGSNKRSALYTSIQLYDIPVHFAGAANDGTFAGAVQPILGNPSDPLQFKVALCNPNLLATESATTNWSSSASYVSNLDGVDPRIDQNLDLLLFPNIGYFNAGLGTGSSATKPFGTAPVFNAGNGFTRVAYDGTTTNGDWVLPNGDYIAIVQFIAGAGLTTITTGGSATASALTVATSTATNVQASYFVTAAPGTNNFWVSSAGAAPTGAGITFVPIARANQTGSYDNGLVQKIRPVAMSTLLTSMVPSLVNGGMISGAFIPGDTLQDAFFSNNSEAPGPLRSYQIVAQVPGSYNGRLEHGLYGIWSTETPDDREFKKPSENNNYDYPTFVFAATYTPSTTPAPGTTVPVVRMEIVQVHEYTTINQFPNTELSTGSQNTVDLALGLLAPLPKVMANATHSNFLQRVMATINRGANFVKSAIGKVEQYAPMIKKGAELVSSFAL